MKNETTNLAIQKVAALAVLAFAICVVVEFASAAADEPKLKKFSYVQLQMAMPMQITVWAESETHAESVCKLAFAKASELVRVFSDYDRSSEAMLLTRNDVGSHTPVSDHLMNVLKFSQELNRESDGAFDVTAGPVIRLWRTARKKSALPTADVLESALECIGIDRIELKDETHSAKLLTEDVELDFGGIAKGYIGDQVVEVLRKNGIAICYYRAGGDIVLGDAPPNTKGWKIDLGKSNDGTLRTMELENCAISTSGDTQQFVEISGTRYSHVVDPRTGIGVTAGRTSFVIAPTGMQSDALATTGCVLDETEFQNLLNKYKDTTGWSESSQLHTEKNEQSITNLRDVDHDHETK